MLQEKRKNKPSRQSLLLVIFLALAVFVGAGFMFLQTQHLQEMNNAQATNEALVLENETLDVSLRFSKEANRLLRDTIWDLRDEIEEICGPHGVTVKVTVMNFVPSYVVTDKQLVIGISDTDTIVFSNGSVLDFDRESIYYERELSVEKGPTTLEFRTQYPSVVVDLC